MTTELFTSLPTVTSYQKRLTALYILQYGRLARYYKRHGKRFTNDEVLARAIHAVNRKLWIYRNGKDSSGMTRAQALAYLEQSIVEKRRPKPAYLFDLEAVPAYRPDYDKSLALSAIVDELLKKTTGRTTAGRYLFLARYARKHDIRPRDIVEVIDRYRPIATIERPYTRDSEVHNNKWYYRSIASIDLVGQLQEYLNKYKGKRIIVYGGPMLFKTMDYTALYTYVTSAYGRPDGKVLIQLYKDYCASGQIYYTTDIMQEYIKRLHNQ